jgi:hypothetical protein
VKDAGATCTPETESNNDPTTANQLAGSVCGTLNPTSELDYLTFTLPANTKTMDLTFQGNVKLLVSVEGLAPVELSPSSNPPVPFAPGKKYLIKISAASGGGKIDWRVNLVVT